MSVDIINLVQNYSIIAKYYHNSIYTRIPYNMCTVLVYSHIGTYYHMDKGSILLLSIQRMYTDENCDGIR